MPSTLLRTTLNSALDLISEDDSSVNCRTKIEITNDASTLYREKDDDCI